MSRLFLSGQMTCAMLLGAGLLLRAQAALHPEPERTPQVVIEAPHTRPAELMGERARTPPRVVVRDLTPQAPRVVKKSSHTRKGFTKRVKRSRVCKHGVALAGRGFRCG